MGGGSVEYEIFQYRWRRGAWSTLPQCPVRRFGLTHFMGRLTTVGGLDRTRSATDCVYEFVSESQRWQKSLPPMPTARFGVTVIAHPSNSPKPPAIVVCGGWGDGAVILNTVEVFCHSTSQWHMAEPLPTPMCRLTSAKVGDITYLLGEVHTIYSFTKRCFSVSLDSLIDKTTSRRSSVSEHSSLWMTVRDTPLTGSRAASLGGSMVAIGGFDSNPSTAIYLLTSSGSWERVRGDLPEPRHCPTAVCLPSGELMVAGGRDKRTLTCTVFIASIVD